MLLEDERCRCMPVLVAADTRLIPTVRTDLTMEVHHETNVKIMVMNAAPRNQHRFLGKWTLVLMGQRYESTNRRNHDVFEPHRTDLRHGRVPPSIDHWRPIHRWPEAEVRKLIESFRINPRRAWGCPACRRCVRLPKARQRRRGPARAPSWRSHPREVMNCASDSRRQPRASATVAAAAVQATRPRATMPVASWSPTAARSRGPAPLALGALLFQNLSQGVDLTRRKEPDPLAGRADEDLGVEPAEDALADPQRVGCLPDGEQPIPVGCSSLTLSELLMVGYCDLFVPASTGGGVTHGSAFWPENVPAKLQVLLSVCCFFVFVS
jgi:hypothetical protein